MAKSIRFNILCIYRALFNANQLLQGLKRTLLALLIFFFKRLFFSSFYLFHLNSVFRLIYWFINNHQRRLTSERKASVIYIDLRAKSEVIKSEDKDLHN